MMRLALCVLLAVCVVADDSEDRRSKLPYVADALGNSLPPPSNVPATVGSPVNLLTPDRYEFYTFDESGELVKRLMTLEEIQAIVAAGEETEGLVTFANENQPTIAFNFSQPPYTKVHNVVTNVQNVLKAQMEAHKNKPFTKPTLDTPDVSDSWSLILPSIFGNTGVDIVPDKTSGTFTTPETETIELDRPAEDNSLSKEGNNQLLSSSSTLSFAQEVGPTTEKVTEATKDDKYIPTTPTKTTTTATTTTTTTQKPTTIAVTTPKLTTRVKPLSTSTNTPKPTSTKITTNKPVTTINTSKPQISTTIHPKTTTLIIKPWITSTSTIRTTTKNAPKLTTAKPFVTTTTLITTTQTEDDRNYTQIQVQTVSSTISSTEKYVTKLDKLSTFDPVSTAAYVTERTTQKPQSTPKLTTAAFSSTTKRSISTTTNKSTTASTRRKPPITTYKPTSSTLSTYFPISSTIKDTDKHNATTVTMHTVSPSTTVSSTEYMTSGNQIKVTLPAKSNLNKENYQEIPLFDISQSISQIASDLGNERPMPTKSDMPDTTKLSEMNLESKENLEIDISFNADTDSRIIVANSTEKSLINFVKISTLIPQRHNKTELVQANESLETTEIISENPVTKPNYLPSITTNSTIDPVLSESMDDLLSQVVNAAPQSIINTDQSISGEKHQNQVNKSENISIPGETFKKPEIISESLIEDKDSEDDITLPLVLIIKKENITNKETIKPTSLKDNYDQKLQLHINTLNKKVNESLLINNNKNHSAVDEYVKFSTSSYVNESKVSTQPTSADLNSNVNVNSSKVNEINKTDIELSSDENIKKQTYSKTPVETLKNPVSTVPKKNEQSIKENRTKVTETLKPINNKITSAENNKISNKNEKVVPETFPKVEDFKKKIQKVNIDDKELGNERNNSWKLISTVSPPNVIEISKDKAQSETHENIENKDIILNFSKENQGLAVTTKDLNEDIAQFTELCNELAFRYWHTMIETIDKKRSFVLSPYSITSMLAMMFMGAKGSTSGEMNEILKLDDMVTFNPHFTLKNISDSIESSQGSGVAVSAFIRELFSDRNKGKILTFYKERAQHFYNGHVEEINFKLISDVIRRRTNLLVKRYTWGRIAEYMKANTISMQPPLAAISANIFQTDCSGSSVEGRDGEMYFVVSPNVRQRRLVPVPAVVYRIGFLAGYDPNLDATAAALGNTNSVISTLFLMPGQQGNIVHAEDLEALENRLLNSNPTTLTWNRLLRTLLPRIGLELQIPRFSHKSIFNVSLTLRKMGLKDIFDVDHADLGGLNGPSKDLYLSDMVQISTFVTCGEGVVAEQHQVEEYPERLEGPQRRRTSRWVNGWDEPRDYQRAFHDPHDIIEAMHLPLHLRPRQARLPARDAQPARLKFDRPFLYFVRHNPSGMILYVGRYNPRLLP